MPAFPVSEESKRIGLRMKQILKQLKVTQEEAAYRLGLSAQGALGSYLVGRTNIPLHIVTRFCSEFHVSITDLFGNDDITVSADDDLVMDIMLIVDEFLSKNHVSLSPDQRKKLIRGFLVRNCHNADRINDTLSTLLAVNGEIFTKRK